MLKHIYGFFNTAGLPIFMVQIKGELMFLTLLFIVAITSCHNNNLKTQDSKVEVLCLSKRTQNL